MDLAGLLDSLRDVVRHSAPAEVHRDWVLTRWDVNDGRGRSEEGLVLSEVRDA